MCVCLELCCCVVALCVLSCVCDMLRLMGVVLSCDVFVLGCVAVVLLRLCV